VQTTPFQPVHLHACVVRGGPAQQAGAATGRGGDKATSRDNHGPARSTAADSIGVADAFVVAYAVVVAVVNRFLAPEFPDSL